MIFRIFTPLPPPPPNQVPLFGGSGGWGGSKLLCALWPLCVYLDLGPEEFFSCIWTPQPMAGSQFPTPGTPSPPPPISPLASEDLAVFPLDRLLSGTGKSPGRSCWIKARQARIYGKTHTTYPPIWGFFGPIRVPYPQGVNLCFNPL